MYVAYDMYRKLVNLKSLVNTWNIMQLVKEMCQGSRHKTCVRGSSYSEQLSACSV